MAALQLQIFKSGIAKSIEPRVFFEGLPNAVLYADHAEPKDPYYYRIFFHDYATDRGGAQRITFAEKAELSVLKETGDLAMHLENSETHSVDPAKPDTYERSSQRNQILIPEDTENLPSGKHKPRKGRMARFQPLKSTRQMNFKEIRTELEALSVSGPHEPLRQQRKNELRIAAHKMFAIPATCFVFAVLGLPLGISNSRGSKLSGFVISVGIFIGFWIFLWGGEKLAENGRLSPAWAMWWGNVFFGVLGLVLFHLHSQYRRPRIAAMLLGTVLWPLRFFQSRRLASATPPEGEHETRALAIEEALTGAAPARRGFIKLLDQYFLRLFAKMFFLVTGSFMALFLVIEAVQLLDEFAASPAPLRVFLGYLLYTVPRFFAWAIPLSALIACLLALSILGRNHELLPLQSAGVSPWRFSRALLAAALLLSAALYCVQDFLVPQASRHAEQLKDALRGKSPRTYMRADRQWIFGENYRLYNYVLFHPEISRMQGFQVFVLNSSDFHVKERIFAKAADWLPDKKVWLCKNGWRREFLENNEERFTAFVSREFSFPETPEYFARERWKSPDSMNVLELREYIAESRQAGYQTRLLEVNLQRKFAFAFLPLVLAFAGVPLAVRLSRRGPLVGFGAGIAMAVAYYSLFIFSSSLGFLGVLPPVAAAWAPVLLFLLAGGVMFWFLLV
jgi:lipopolysaccharide export system permease protein